MLKLRKVTGALLLLTMVGSHAFVCAPSAAAQPPVCDMMTMAADHDCCPPAARMTCCATPDDSAPAVPETPQQRLPRHDIGAIPLSLDDAPAIAVRAVTHILRAAPPHGYRSTDLPTLNSAFLL